MYIYIEMQFYKCYTQKNEKLLLEIDKAHGVKSHTYISKVH